MTIYVLKGMEKDRNYADEDFIIGVYSSREKAEEIIEKYGEVYFYDCKFEIEDLVLDSFEWQRA